MLAELNQRSRDILREIVDAYVESGEPVGSRTLARRLGAALSPASIRNVMADLEEAGLLYAPHTSAGRVPTEAGLRLFIDGLLELGHLSDAERRDIEARCSATGRSVSEVLAEASAALSGLAGCAGLVVAPKVDRPLRHLEFVQLAPGRALVVIVTEDGIVENRVFELPPGVPQSALTTASNYLSARLAGRTLGEARTEILRELEEHRAELDALSARVVERGIAVWGGEGARGGQLIVRGQANLLADVAAIADLERIRALFERLETRETMARLLEAAQGGAGVKIFIGAESDLFAHTGCSMVITPYKNSREQIVGALGVIGPTRLNYARIIPMVDYTAKLVGRMLG